MEEQTSWPVKFCTPAKEKVEADKEAEIFVIQSVVGDAATALNKLVGEYKNALPKITPLLNVPGTQREQAIDYITSLRDEARKILYAATKVDQFDPENPATKGQIPYYFRTLLAIESIVDKYFPKLVLTYPESHWAQYASAWRSANPSSSGGTAPFPPSVSSSSAFTSPFRTSSTASPAPTSTYSAFATPSAAPSTISSAFATPSTGTSAFATPSTSPSGRFSTSTFPSSSSSAFSQFR